MKRTPKRISYRDVLALKGLHPLPSARSTERADFSLGNSNAPMQDLRKSNG